MGTRIHNAQVYNDAEEFLFCFLADQAKLTLIGFGICPPSALGKEALTFLTLPLPGEFCMNL